MDSHFRSIAKTISWRVCGTLINSLVVWVITGSAGLGAIVGVVDNAIKLGLFYAHERAWERARFGRADPPEYHI